MYSLFGLSSDSKPGKLITLYYSEKFLCLGTWAIGLSTTYLHKEPRKELILRKQGGEGSGRHPRVLRQYLRGACHTVSPLLSRTQKLRTKTWNGWLIKIVVGHPEHRAALAESSVLAPCHPQTCRELANTAVWKEAWWTLWQKSSSWPSENEQWFSSNGR